MSVAEILGLAVSGKSSTDVPSNFSVVGNVDGKMPLDFHLWPHSPI